MYVYMYVYSVHTLYSSYYSALALFIYFRKLKGAKGKLENVEIPSRETSKRDFTTDPDSDNEECSPLLADDSKLK